MGAQCVSKSFVLQIRDIEFGCGAFHNARNFRVVYMANFREKVMFHLEIQTTHIPGQQAVFPREIDRGIHLMNGPIILNDPICIGQWMACFFHRVCQLKNDRQDNATNGMHQ